MPAELHCPKCQSPNVILSKKRNFYICEDCGHELPADKAVAPLRIFLNYGHDANEELVRRIKADLEKPPHNHDVWFDKTDIRPGDNWRRSITDGIIKCHRFLSFLSKHSTRDPGVCRDEIALAIGVKDGLIQTILVESEQEVQSPVNIGHIQWLDMHEWKQAHGVVHSDNDKDGNPYALGNAAWEQWYQAKFAEIVRVVESDESQRFVSYSHRQEAWKDRLMVVLRPLEEQRQITAWHDRKLLPGQPWDGVIREELDRSDLVLLLVGPDFIASPYCRDVEVRRAVERAETGDAVLIPIIVERCDWQKEPFAAFQSLPLDGSALSESPDVEATLLDCREKLGLACVGHWYPRRPRPQDAPST